tara:strand:- start:20184 stop:22781 length:2598 start_codon:yes stop_codon:yes gene_type:complete
MSNGSQFFKSPINKQEAMKIVTGSGGGGGTSGKYLGEWNATTNTPTLPNPPTAPTYTSQDFFDVTVAGTQFGIDFTVGDILIVVPNGENLEWAARAGGFLDSITGTGVDNTDPANPVITITPTVIGLGNVDNISDVNKPVSTATQTALDLKLDEVNSIYKPNYTKYCVDNRDELSTIIASITNQGTVVNISQGSFGGATPLVINKDNIALIAPPSTPALVEFAYEISTASTADRIRMRYLSFDADFNAASNRSTYNHCTFNENLNIQTSATAGYMTFANCEFAAGKIISVQNTYASVVYFINCNFDGCSFALNQFSNQQVIFSNCAGFVSFPTNATYAAINTLTSGYIQNTVTKTLLATGAGSSGQVLTSGGSGGLDTWTTPGGGGTGLAAPYKIVRATGGDYTTVYAAYEAGNKFIFVDPEGGTLLETADIVAFNQITMIEDVVILVGIGTWSPIRCMQSISAGIKISGMSRFLSIIKPQNPGNPANYQFFGINAKLGSETSNVEVSNIYWNNSAMTAANYGQIMPVGTVLFDNVTFELPNYSGNSFNLNGCKDSTPATVKNCVVIGGGVDCEQFMIYGPNCVIDNVQLLGMAKVNQTTAQSAAGQCLVYDPIGGSDARISNLTIGITNPTASDEIWVHAGGSNENFLVTGAGKLSIMNFGNNTVIDHVNFKEGRYYQYANGTKINVSNSTLATIEKEGVISINNWSFSRCKFTGATLTPIAPLSLFDDCEFSGKVEGFDTINSVRFSECNILGDFNLAGNQGSIERSLVGGSFTYNGSNCKVDGVIGSSTAAINGNGTTIVNSEFWDTIIASGDNSNIISNTTSAVGSKIESYGNYNFIAMNRTKTAPTYFGTDDIVVNNMIY